MNSIQDCYTMSNGLKIPCVGYGTYKSPNDIKTTESIIKAIEVGYRHIDTASMYDNENCVGEAVKRSDIDRKELFITSKLWNDVRGYDNTMTAFYKSLDKLKLDYMDLYLIHWPAPLAFRDNYNIKNIETWRAMEHLYKQGLIKSIGVSNFLIHHIEPIMSNCEIAPMVNQIEIHPSFYDEKIINFCKNNNIVVEAWSPLMRGRNLDNSVLTRIAEKHNKTNAQICLRWSVEKGYLPLPKTLNYPRMIENGDIFDFALDGVDIKEIDTIKTIYPMRVGSDPDNCPF